MVKFIKTPFANSGTKTAVPNDTQLDGSVSYNEGFGIDYQKVYPTDASAKAFPRAQFNEIVYDVTSNIQQYQIHGIPEFITSVDNGGTPYPYSKYAVVRYDSSGLGTNFKTYQSRVDNNVDLPTVAASWVILSKSLLAASVYLIAAQNIISATDGQKIQYDTVYFDPFSWWDNTNKWMLVPFTGKYRIHAATQVSNTATPTPTGPNEGRFIEVRTTTGLVTTIQAVLGESGWSGGTANEQDQGSTILDLTAGDKVFITIGAGTLTNAPQILPGSAGSGIGIGTYFEIEYLGDYIA